MKMTPIILILKKNNITDFAKARNELMKKSKGDWFLFLDSDETISNSKFQISNKFSSYQLTRKNYFLGQYVGSEKIIRLVKKNSGKWVRKVHEIFVPKRRAGYLPNVIVHNTANNLSDYINKINYYSDLHAKENKNEGKKSNLFKIIFYPISKFFVTLVKSGNIVFSIMQSLHSFLSWTKLLFYYS